MERKMTKISILTNPRKAAEIYTHTHTHTHTDKPCWLNFSQFILIPIFVFAPLAVLAVDINEGDSATCDSGVLNTDTGPVNLRAEYEAETINLKWYNENTRVTVPNASGSCTYDTAISLPPNPTRPGYKFKGWKVFSKWDFSTLDYTIDGTTEYANTQNNTWDTTFSYGVVSGVSLCSSTYGVEESIGTPNESETGKYCWCRVTKYKANSDDITYEPLTVLPWVIPQVLYSDTLDCMLHCAGSCTHRIRSYVNVRRAMFGQSGS